MTTFSVNEKKTNITCVLAIQVLVKRKSLAWNNGRLFDVEGSHGNFTRPQQAEAQVACDI